MDELICIMGEIRDQLIELNNKLDNLTNFGMTNISDILDEIKSIGAGYDISDVCNKLDQIDTSISFIDISR